MRKLLLFATLLALGAGSMAQKSPYIKKPTFGLHFFVSDFATGQAIKDTGFSNAFKGGDWRDVKKMDPGMAVSFHKGITKNIDWSAVAGLSFVDYAFKNRTRFGINSPLWTLDVNAQFKLLSDKHVVSPYINVGVGGSYYKGFIGAYAPLGLGLQVNLNDAAFIFLNTQYRVDLTDNTSRHLFHSIGVAGSIASDKPAVREIAPPILPPPPPPPPPAPKDSDGDGITDDVDKCPNEAGVAKYQGCPVPDSDGDGINDDNDRCPNQPGVSKYQGCPIPDGDGDGINDDEDKCPTVPGIAANQGCPEIKKDDIDKVNYAAKNIYFATGSAKLLTKSYGPLNEVAKIMEANGDLKLDIGGHTDNTGDAARNTQLSEERATAVKAYLAGKGVSEDRLNAAGYGSDQPAGDNKTAAGRAKNRRVELKLSY
jgi:OmpA-OmpF porin, OOP family